MLLSPTSLVEKLHYYVIEQALILIQFRGASLGVLHQCWKEAMEDPVGRACILQAVCSPEVVSSTKRLGSFFKMNFDSNVVEIQDGYGLVVSLGT